MKWGACVAACGLAVGLSTVVAQAGTVEGTATYVERIAAPPGAVFEAQLQDTSRADAAVTLLGRFRREAAGNPPYAFTIAYQLRQTFVGQPEPNRFDDIGRWITHSAGGAIELRGTREESIFVERVGADLRKLDPQGKRIDSASGHSDLLKRRPRPAPIEPRLALTGMFRYFADAASIELCADGRRLPVAMQGDYLALERTYSAAAQAAPGQPLLVSLEGTIAPRPSAEESLGPVPTLVVERFGKVWPRESCGTPLADSPLRNTYWKLTRLNGEPAVVAENQREPHLIFNMKEPRVAGSGGCNRLMGGFEANGRALRLSKMTSTMMACPDGMTQEAALLAALGRVASYRVRGSHLDLFDAQRQVLARFEAVALK